MTSLYLPLSLTATQNQTSRARTLRLSLLRRTNILLRPLAVREIDSSHSFLLLRALHTPSRLLRLFASQYSLLPPSVNPSSWLAVPFLPLSLSLSLSLPLLFQLSSIFHDTSSP